MICFFGKGTSGTARGAGNREREEWPRSKFWEREARTENFGYRKRKAGKPLFFKKGFSRILFYSLLFPYLHFPTSSSLPLPFFVTSSGLRFHSRARISMTIGWQKPP